MKTLRRKLFLSILAVAFAVVSLATSTFAWFAMNDEVTATAMTATVKTSENLFIAAKGDYANGAEIDEADGFGTTVAMNVKGQLQPSSTVDAEHFFKVNDASKVSNAGAKGATDTYVAWTEGVDATTVSGDAKTGAFVKFDLYLKVVTNNSSNATVRLNGLNLIYTKNDAESVGNNKAMRVGIIAAADDSSVLVNSEDNNKTRIYAPDGAEYFTDEQAVAAAGNTTAAFGSGVLGGALEYEILPSKTAYFKVTVVLWLEGEDKTCNNDTFVNLTGSYALDLKFTIGPVNPRGASVTNLNLADAA